MLRPRSIAVVGASATPGALGQSLLANLERFAYRGDLHLVSATRSEIGGRPCLKSTFELPEGVDCATLAIPRAGILEAVQGCAARGVGGVIIYAAGFAETGPEGQRLQVEIARIARDRGMAVSGPNCLGHINYVDGIPLTFSSCAPVPLAGRRGIGIVSQSGAMATVFRAALHPRDIAISHSISTGNEALNGTEDFLDFLIEDEATHVILMLVEQFRQPQRFLAAARRAHAAGKPIVLLHPGRSAAAQASAKTHTGALSGDYEVMRALVAHAGVVLVDTLEELHDLGELMIRWPSRPRGGVAVISDSGAFKAMVLDFCEHSDLEVPEPAGTTKDSLAALAPDLILPTNPLDVTAQSLVDPDLYRRAMKPFLDDPRYGSVVLCVVLSSPTHSQRKMAPIINALTDFGPPKPVVFAMMGEDSEVAPEITAQLRNLGVPFFRSPERTLRALAKLAALRPPQAALSAPLVAPADERLPSGVMPEYAAKKVLTAAGIPIPRAALARDLGDAQRAVAQIGYPVVLKAQSAALSHKSDVGGVALGIADEASLAAAWGKLHADIARARADLNLEGVLVEAMARPGVELILGARNDPDWGPSLTIGLGGVWTEALRDVRLMPALLAPAAIADEFRKLKGALLLTGYRGRPALDIDAAAEIAAKLGQFVSAHPEIAEIDINPLVVYPKGEGVIAIDALIVAR
ncbi:MAG: acetate--CoA ligase family protein [Xanthobacteraceae bacterium]|nr:acetate--CoA ligase family protein [Xanthobacteraceae bacterium]